MGLLDSLVLGGEGKEVIDVEKEKRKREAQELFAFREKVSEARKEKKKRKWTLVFAQYFVCIC